MQLDNHKIHAYLHPPDVMTNDYLGSNGIDDYLMNMWARVKIMDLKTSHLCAYVVVWWHRLNTKLDEWLYISAAFTVYLPASTTWRLAGTWSLPGTVLRSGFQSSQGSFGISWVRQYLVNVISSWIKDRQTSTMTVKPKRYLLCRTCKYAT